MYLGNLNFTQKHMIFIGRQVLKIKIQVLQDRCSSVWRSCDDTIPGYAELIWYVTGRYPRKKLFNMVSEQNGDTGFSSSVAHYDVVKKNQWLCGNNNAGRRD